MAQHPVVAAFQHSKFFHYLSCLEHWWQIRDRKWGKSVIVFSNTEKEAEGRASGVAPTTPDSLKMELRSILSEEKFYDLCRDFATKVFDEVASSQPGAQVVVDKTPENMHLSEFILKIFPDAYFLHLIRDPRSVFCSLRAMKVVRWEFPTKPIDGAKFWCSEVETGLRIKELTSRYREVRYEALHEDGPGELEKIFSWLNLASDPELCERAMEACTLEKIREDSKMPSGFFRKGAKDGWRQELSQRDVRIIEHIARDLMKQLGYECTQKPFKRKPLGIQLQEGAEWGMSHLDRNLNRISRHLLRRCIGREREFPEFILH